MKIGDRVTVTLGGEIIDSKITYTDKKKSCGYVTVSPQITRQGHILGYKSGWFSDYWIVGLDEGTIIKVRA